jgi:flagellar motility protein MotE (MotC chaperone)
MASSQPSMSFLAALVRLRAMPLTITFLCLLFTIKLYDLAVGTNELSQMLLAGEAIAVTPQDSAKEDPAKAEENKRDDSAKQEDKDKKKESAEEKKPESPEKSKERQVASVDAEDAKDATEELSKKRDFSPIEVNLLQSLSERRDQISKWEEEVRMKESLLEATELRVKKRIAEIKRMEKGVRALLEQYQKQEEINVRSLVKIYESMKPKDAARIFDELEMPVLLMVVDRMSERKAAPIFAGMDPKKAKMLTMELAAQKKVLDDSKEALDGAAAQ